MDKALYPLLIVFVFALIYSLSPLQVLLHEFGHAFFCKLCGGTIKEIGLEEPINETMTISFVRCDMKNKSFFCSQIFMLGGIIFELVLAASLLLVKKLSGFGGFVFFKFCGNWFYKSYYIDLQFFPFLMSLPVRIFVLALGAIVFFVSVERMFKSWL